jgi:hypothetical protein
LWPLYRSMVEGIVTGQWREGIRIPKWPPRPWTKFGPARPPGILNEGPCLAWVRREQKSGVEGRQIRQPLHQDVQLLRILPSQSGIELVVELYRFPLRLCPAYIAWSYCWGDETLERSVICGRARINTTRSLYSIVDAIRLYNMIVKGGRPYFWIHQICINEENTREREAQVRIMGNIYQKARACFVYLGEASEDTRTAFNLVGKIAAIGPAFTDYMHDGKGLEGHRLPSRDAPCW